MQPALLVALLAAASAADVKVHCTDAPVRAPEGAGPALRVQGQERSLWVAWRTELDRTIGERLLHYLQLHPRCALLRCRLALCHVPGGLCDLLEGNPDRTFEGLNDAIVAGFASSSDLSCRTVRLFNAVRGCFRDASATRLLVAEKNVLHKHAPWLLAAMVVFDPSQDASIAPAPVARPEQYSVLVYRCESDREQQFEELLRETCDALADATRPHLVEAIFQERVLRDCLSQSELRARLQEELARGTAYRLLGAVAAGAGVREAARSLVAPLPVVSYDAQPRDAGGALQAGARPERQARELRALLAACGWRRVALLSEDTPAARALAAELRAEGPLRRVALSPDDAQLRATLAELRAADARVLVLNAGAAGARRALRLAAQEPLAGRAWVAREWARGAAPPLRPLLALRSARPRPPADALRALVLGSAQLFEKYEELRFDHLADGTRELLRRLLAEGLKGVGPEFEFDARGLIQPEASVELWPEGANGTAEPELWPPGRCPLVVPTSDGARNCTLPAGDRFAPTCFDALVALGAPALLLAALLAGYGAAGLRRRAAARRRARERRLRAEASTALLARQRDTGPALAALLVESERVTLLRALGAGRHGRVWLAELAPERALLAAKAPHEGCSPAEEGELLREAAALAPLRHAHVVRLLGVCVGPGPPLLLTAVAQHGDLLRYLRARRPPGCDAREAAHVAAGALTRLAREAALALAYLASRGIVHCDVRAANCLLDERRELKLADFGMARSLGGGARESGGASEYYACRRRALFPVLWMAPESLARGAFSTATDVWALGVLALELVSLGARPFGALSAADAVALVSRGGHARLPQAASAQTRSLARACWRREARLRPSASAVAAWLAARPTALAPAPQPDAPDGDRPISRTEESPDRSYGFTEADM